MFCVTERDAAAIRQAFLKDGKFAATVELRRRFVGITSNADARRSVQMILGWPSATTVLAEASNDRRDGGMVDAMPPPSF
ncbi:hypothetical protein [Teichococcus vastitatis]|uniref:Uncharacterized protein n=1 Tax=Teichococcus vastitatis TaxID=2307076 RepID=A0ABS9WA08_9PROT|nr:hypothetical protein [Pseudoroseomonas vastitatis]MCI0756136.1 hypothetical protein [Pseudoroseomonas vastitatis]